MKYFTLGCTLFFQTLFPQQFSAALVREERGVFHIETNMENKIITLAQYIWGFYQIVFLPCLLSSFHLIT